MATYFALVALIVFSAKCVVAQTTTRLPPPPSYPDGRFISPDTSKEQIFEVGSNLPVYWTTNFDYVHLYLIFNAEYNNPCALLVGSPDKSYDWEVSDYGNNSFPFNFRIVDAKGTDAEQRSGGFYTGQFWISRKSDQSTATASSTSSATTFSGMTSATSSSASSETKTDASPATSTPASISATAPSAAETETSKPTEGGSDATTIGVGVGVGAGVGVAAVILAIWFFLRRHYRRKASSIQQPLVPMQNADERKDTGHISAGWSTSNQRMELDSGDQGYYGPLLKSPVEAPAGQTDPSELAGSDAQPRRRV